MLQTEAATNTGSFAEAAKAGDYFQVIRMAEEQGLLGDLSSTTNIGLHTLRGMQRGNITPSKNQRRKLFDAALTL